MALMRGRLVTSLFRKLSEPFECNRSVAALSSSSQYGYNQSWEITNFSSDPAAVLRLNRAKPSPTIRSPNELIVQVNSASVNPLDVLMCSGYGNEVLEKLGFLTQCQASQISHDRFPLTLGRDFSGVVVDKGSAVKNVCVGDQVFGAVPPYKHGTHSKYVVVTDSEVS